MVDMERFRQRRRAYIGGSDVGAIMGAQGAFLNIHEVYLEKMGLRDSNESEAMRWGNILEPVVIEEYERQMNARVLRPVESDGQPKLVTHPEYPFIGGHPDGIVVDEAGNWLHGFEAKTGGFMSKRNWGEPFTDQVPHAYSLQCHTYMACTRLPRWDIGALFNGNDFKIYIIKRDPEIEQMIIEACVEFKRRLDEQDPPEPDGSIGAAKLLQAMSERGDRTIEPTPEIDRLVDQYFSAKKAADMSEEAAQRCKNHLMDIMKGTGKVRGANYSISWSAYERKNIKYKDVIEEANVPSDIILKHTTASEQHRFVITPGKDSIYV